MSVKKIVSNVRPSGPPDSPAVFSLLHGFKRIQLNAESEIYLLYKMVCVVQVYQYCLFHALQKISEINFKILMEDSKAFRADCG